MSTAPLNVAPADRARPLVIRFGALGDLVQCTVLLSRLWRASGRPCDLVTGHPGASMLLSGLPFVGEVILVPSRRQMYPLSVPQRQLVGRLRALLSMADSFIGLDSGPAHMAAALGCPAVVLFGRADPRRVAPRGIARVACLSGLRVEDWPDDPGQWAQRNRMEGIEVDAVVDAWRGLRIQSGAAK